jgi:hypothetical protein
MVAMRQTAPGYSLPRDSSALHASDLARKVGLAADSVDKNRCAPDGLRDMDLVKSFFLRATGPASRPRRHFITADWTH